MSVAQPLLGYGATGPAPVLSFLSQFAFITAVGFAASGISKTGGSSSPVVRFSATLNGLATVVDQSLPSSDTAINTCYGLGTTFVVGDNLGAIFTSVDGSTWHQAVNSSGASLATVQGGVFDDVNNKIIVATQNAAQVVTTTPGSGALTFVAHSVSASANGVQALAYRPGSGVTLALLASGGTDHGNVYRSTDGGATWSLTASHIFGAGVNNSDEIAYCGAGQWAAFGGDTNGLLCISTDNGSTWSAPSVWTTDSTLPGIITSNNSGTLLFWNNNGNYYVSTDNGSTWAKNPGALPTNDGVGAFGLTWDGTNWGISLTSADDSAQFFATSTDAIHWVQGPNVTD